MLDVPASFKGKNLFDEDHLRKEAEDLLFQQMEALELLEKINGEPEWEVEKVLVSQLFGKSRKLQYQVLWKECDPDDIWYLACNLKNSSTLWETFHENYPNTASPPLRLAH
jgi:hypothetical protein